MTDYIDGLTNQGSALPALVLGMQNNESNVEAQAGGLDALAALTMENGDATELALAGGVKGLSQPLPADMEHTNE
eukprot:2730531-Prymnesium_polylepis.2